MVMNVRFSVLPSASAKEGHLILIWGDLPPAKATSKHAAPCVTTHQAVHTMQTYTHGIQGDMEPFQRPTPGKHILKQQKSVLGIMVIIAQQQISRPKESDASMGQNVIFKLSGV